MEGLHPTLWSLVQDPLEPDVAAHLASCPKCRVEARLFVQVQATDPETLEGIAEARSALREARDVSIHSLERTIDSDSDGAAGLEPGRVIDRYVVEARLGAGGMATVYLVRHARLDSLHALKVMHRTTLAERDRLVREGRAQGRLRHPNVVAVTDVVDVDGAPGLIIEYVDGPTLHQYLAQHGPPPLAEVDRLATGILRGVATAHRAGLVHRDLKPGNVLLAPGDEGYLPKVTDFGLVRSTDPDSPRLTRSGLPMGTPSYMAPEQLRDASRADARSDLFSLGALLYELVTGQRAFRGLHWLDIADRIRTGRYTPPGAVVEELPDRMARTIERCLEVDPAARFADCEAALAAWMSEPAPQPERAPARTTWGRWALALALVALLGVAGLAVGAAAGFFAAREPAPEVPWTTSSPQVQATFEAGWAHFLDGDPVGAIPFFARTEASRPHAVLPAVLKGVCEDLAGGRGQAMRTLQQAVESAGDEPGRDATLARLVDARLYGVSSDEQAWARLLARYPRDYLVAVLATWRMPGPDDAVLRQSARTVELRPHAAIGYVVRLVDLKDREREGNFVDTMRKLGERTTWRPELDWDLTAGPGALVLHRLQHVMGPEPSTTMQRSMLKLMRDHPDSPDVRYAYARSLQDLGDPQGAREQLDLVFAQTTPVMARLRLARADARHEFGLGHVRTARARIGRCRLDAELAGLPAEAVLCADERVRLALRGTDATELEAAMGELAQLREKPGVPAELRARMVSGAKYLDGRLALLRGDYRTAWQDAEAIRGGGDEYVWWLDREAAATDLSRRASPADHAGAELPGDEPASRAERARLCARNAAWLRMLGNTAPPARRLDLLARVLSSCLTWEEERAAIARADVVLAELALGPPIAPTPTALSVAALNQNHVAPDRFPDPQAAGAMIAAFHATWPDPDPERPLVARAQAVETALAAPE